MRKLFAAAVLAAFSVSANAAPVTWTLDATFTTGQTFTGTFDYDENTNNYSSINLSISGAEFALSHDYGVYDRTPYPVNSIGLIWENPTNVIWDRNISSGCSNEGVECFVIDDLQFASALSSAGGLINVTGYRQWIEGIHNDQVMLSGTVSASAVPVPAAVWLFGSALAGLGWMRRKQTV